MQENYKKEEFLRSLKNIEDKSEQQLKIIKSKNEHIKEVTDFVEEFLSLKVKVLIEEIKIIQRNVQEIKKILRQKNKLLDNVKNFCKGRKNIIEGFKNKISPIYHDDEDSRFENIDEDDIRNNNGLIDCKKVKILINIKEGDINDNLVRKNFLVQDLRAFR